MKARTKRRWPLVALILVLVVTAVGITAVVVVRHTYQENLKPVSKSENQVEVTIPTGSTVTEISSKLKKAGLIRESWAFEWYVRSHDLRDKLKAGTYSFAPSQSIPDIADTLAQGKVATNLVTILPGKRLDQIRAALINSGFKPSDVDEALKPENYANHPALVDKPAGASLEGYLYPESFQKTAETSPKQIVRASLDEMQKRLTPELRAGIAKQGLSVHEGIILASIIEKEVDNAADRPIVAQVFLRRLKGGMKLESNVTAIYGAIVAGKTPSLTFDSPYNTYVHAGLPVGPISNEAVSALQAVANPTNTEYLYFVAGDDGKTYFSSSLAEHEQLVRDHCHEKCKEL